MFIDDFSFLVDMHILWLFTKHSEVFKGKEMLEKHWSPRFLRQFKIPANLRGKFLFQCIFCSPTFSEIQSVLLPVRQ